MSFPAAKLFCMREMEAFARGSSPAFAYFGGCTLLTWGFSLGMPVATGQKATDIVPLAPWALVVNSLDL